MTYADFLIISLQMQKKPKQMLSHLPKAMHGISNRGQK